jgi:adenosylmethionine-8-amino-7-oxononanoate aminotransferase
LSPILFLVKRAAQLDHRHVWHPFTQMRDWLQREPLMIREGQGAVLRDDRGREFLDANSSIWTNLHGHNHPRLNRALRGQLGKLAHCSALGLANEPAAELAGKLSGAAGGRLVKTFFSDDGSTALEVAIKLAYEYTRRTGRSAKPRFVAMQGAYHGDTVGAVSVGHIDLFHRAYAGMLFQSDAVMAPYCYRCPFNRAKPERNDARKYRKCNWECVGKVERTFARQKQRGNPYAAFVFEPLMQGAAGMIPQPSGWLKQVTDIARGHGALLIADEVMTGFGRTGITCHVTDAAIAKAAKKPERVPVFATSRLKVPVDFLCVAKGLTGGYLPMAATLTTKAVFDAFLGRYEEFKTFFHGHSYTGNPLGAAVSLASLAELQSRKSVIARGKLQRALEEELQTLWALPNVGDIRQVGLIAGVELVRDWKTRQPFELRERAGIRVCEAMTRRGVLTRPIGSVVVLMPPYCTTRAQVRKMVGALREAIEEVFGPGRI